MKSSISSNNLVYGEKIYRNELVSIMSLIIF